jgi:hypothetical protein
VPLVSVLATGGTIASRSDPGGAATAQDAGADLVSGLPLPADVRVRVRVRDVLRVGGFRMTLDRVHTLAAAVAADAFANPHGGPLGWVHHGDLGIVTRPRRSPALDLAAFDPAGVRVDVVPCYPDADATALRALAEVGARGLVLEATGAGNANPGICTAVRGLTDARVAVVTSTRVAAGPVVPIYGTAAGSTCSGRGRCPAACCAPPRPGCCSPRCSGCTGMRSRSGTRSCGTRPVERSGDPQSAQPAFLLPCWTAHVFPSGSSKKTKVAKSWSCGSGPGVIAPSSKCMTPLLSMPACWR